MSEHARWTLYAYVLMEHHLHWLASAPDLVHEVRCFKSFTARTLIEDLMMHRAQWLLDQLACHKQKHKTGQQYQVWQDGCHAKQILSDAMLRQKIDYVHQNPMH